MIDPREAGLAVRERDEEWLEILTELIRIPSENPPGETTEIAAYLRELLTDRGVDHETVAPKPEMPNVVAQFDGDRAVEDPPHLAFNGHLDTFPAGETDRWERDPFAGTVEDGTVHGRGATDMHAGFTASLAAFLYLHERREELPGTVTLAAVSDEETGSQWGTDYLLENYPDYRGDAVINGEPSTTGLVRFGGRGVLWLEIDVRGASDHSAYPGGTNAIEVLTAYVDELQDVVAEAGDVADDLDELLAGSADEMDRLYGEGAAELVRSARANLNWIEGGSQINVTPETATGRVDIRLPLGTEGDPIVERARQLREGFPGEITVEVLTHTDPTYTDPDHPILEDVCDSVASVHGREPGLACGLGFTDVRLYRTRGIPCAVYGPDPHNMGSQNEYVTVEDFLDVAAVHTMAATRYLNRSLDGA